MRILIGLESYYPNVSGVTIFVKRLAAFLAQSGNEVRILTTRPRGTASEERDPAGFMILRFRGWPNPFRYGLRVTFPWEQRAIGRILDSFKPDVVHLQDPAILSRMVFKEARKRRLPVLMHHHFSLEFVLSYFKQIPPLLPIVRAFIKYRMRTFYNQCDLVITPTAFVKQNLISWKIKTPIVAISNGIELSRFIPEKPEEAFYKKYGIHTEDNIALYLGRLDKDKNIQTLVKAIPLILEKAKKEMPGASFRFIFVGEGTDRKALEEHVSKQEWRDCVTFLGFVPRESEDLPKLYRASDIYWIASTIETQSITTLEAMACGLPVVAAHAGALPEIVRENENGFLVDPYGEGMFVDRVMRIFSDQALAERFSKRSREIASGHDIEKSFQRMIDTYKNAVTRAPRA